MIHTVSMPSVVVASYSGSTRDFKRESNEQTRPEAPESRVRGDHRLADGPRVLGRQEAEMSRVLKWHGLDIQHLKDRELRALHTIIHEEGYARWKDKMLEKEK